MFFKLQTTQLANGVTVASLDTGAAVSSLAVCVKAGPRHETYENLGANHALRAAAGLSSSKHSSLATVRTIQQVGGKVDVVGSREYTLYCSQAPRNAIDEGTLLAMKKSLLKNVSSFFFSSSHGLLHFNGGLSSL